MFNVFEQISLKSLQKVHSKLQNVRLNQQIYLKGEY